MWRFPALGRVLSQLVLRIHKQVFTVWQAEKKKRTLLIIACDKEKEEEKHTQMVFDPGLFFSRRPSVPKECAGKRKRWRVDIINIHHSSCWWSKDKKTRRSCRVTLDLKETEERMMKNPPPSLPFIFFFFFFFNSPCSTTWNMEGGGEEKMARGWYKRKKNMKKETRERPRSTPIDGGSFASINSTPSDPSWPPAGRAGWHNNNKSIQKHECD